jgi:hypothetical protein
VREKTPSGYEPSPSVSHVGLSSGSRKTDHC